MGSASLRQRESRTMRFGHLKASFHGRVRSTLGQEACGSSVQKLVLDTSGRCANITSDFMQGIRTELLLRLRLGLAAR